MRKAILVVLMAVMVATPCLAQEVEPDELFSIEGTQWTACGISFVGLKDNEKPATSINNILRKFKSTGE